MSRTDPRANGAMAAALRHSLASAGTALICTVAFSGCGPPDPAAERPRSTATATATLPPDSPDRSPLTDVTEEVGLDFVHINGMSGERYFVEMVGAGAAMLDYDNDGDLDLYLLQGHALGAARTNGTQPVDRLYRNDLELQADGSRVLRFTDVTEASELQAGGYAMGVATGDYNNDGWIDIYVANWGPNQLWRNNGDGTFTDVTAESGTGEPSWSTGASFADIDLDGWLDLMVVNYNQYSLEGDRPCYAPSGRREYCGPDAYPVDQDHLFLNLRDGRFEDITLKSGLSAAQGPALGVISTDFNLDGLPDFYVANDGRENHLWLNLGGNRFEESALMAGVALNAAGIAEASMGVVAEDFDGDWDKDLFLTHLQRETNTFYVNQGDVLFEDRTQSTGLGMHSRVYTGFGIAPFDFDLDGWLDLFVANGAVRIIPEQAERGDPLPLKQRNQLFQGLGSNRFREVRPPGPIFELEEVTRGVAYGDVDNDGDTDILLSNNNGPARLLLNEVGQSQPWLGLRLALPGSRRDALGARVAALHEGQPIMWRCVRTDGSYGSAHDPRVRFGFGASPRADAVRVHWHGGQVETWYGLPLNRYHTLVQGEGQPDV